MKYVDDDDDDGDIPDAVILCDIGAFLSSCRRSLVMQGCRYWDSHVFASMQREPTRLNQCSVI